MTSERETVVMDFLAQLHDPLHVDLDVALAGFAEDAAYQVLVPSRAPLRGRAAIKAELARQFLLYDECDCEILAVASNDRYVFTERRDHVHMVGLDKRIFSSVNAVFEFDDTGRIVAWREYWDSGDINRQLGLTEDQQRHIHGTD